MNEDTIDPIAQEIARAKNRGIILSREAAEAMVELREEAIENEIRIAEEKGIELTEKDADVIFDSMHFHYVRVEQDTYRREYKRGREQGKTHAQAHECAKIRSALLAGNAACATLDQTRRDVYSGYEEL